MNDYSIEFSRLYSIIQTLRSPEGCPWDREQSPESIKGNLLEEAYETVDAITSGSVDDTLEELGDMYLLTTMLTYMYEQQKAFSLKDVLQGICEKLIRRHPHVFSDSDAETPDAVIEQWNEIKKTEKKRKEPESILKSISRTLPPLERAFLIQKKAAEVGFDWERKEDVLEKIKEELTELQHALSHEKAEHVEEEVGDLLFSAVNIARYLDIDPMIALHSTNQKFMRRFSAIEEDARSNGTALSDLSLKEMDEVWNRAKNKK